MKLTYCGTKAVFMRGQLVNPGDPFEVDADDADTFLLRNDFKKPAKKATKKKTAKAADKGAVNDG